MKTQLFDVWMCFTNGRTTYKAVRAVGIVEDAIAPANAFKHLERIEAYSKRSAIRVTRLYAKCLEGAQYK